MTRSLALADSFIVQSMVAFFRTASTSSLAILLQCFVAQHLYCAVVNLQGIVEGQLILGQTEILAAFMGSFHLLGQLDELFDDLGSLYGAIVILVDRLIEHLSKGSRLNQVPVRYSFDLVVEQLPQKLQGQIPVRQTSDLLQELLGEDGDIRGFNASRLVDVHNTIRHNGLGDDLPYSDIQIIFCPAIG